jgi:ArsR family transcriptional regulator
LGFTPEQLEGWAQDADLTLSASVFLAQRNGFQIQVQHFQRC